MEIKSHLTKKQLLIQYKIANGTITEKCCTKCNSWHSIDNFGRLIGSFLDKHNHCNDCIAKKAKDSRRTKGIGPKVPEFREENGVHKRQCTKCNIFKSLEEYNKNASGFAGHDSECRDCKNKRSELYRRDKGIRPQKEIPIRLDDEGNATHRECCRCYQMLPLELFHKHKTAKYGVHPYCSTCARERHLVEKYNLTLKDKEVLYAQQNKMCKICDSQLPIEKLVVDHCHDSGKVRGLLCDRCNTVLGKIGDCSKETIELCQGIIEYAAKFAGR
jgi:hypothetical protein